MSSPSEAKVLASGWVDPVSGGDDTGFRRSLGYSTGWNFQFTPGGAGKLAEMKIQAPGAQSFSELGKWRYEGSMVLGRRIYRDGSNFLDETLTRNELGMLTGIDVDGGNTLHEEIRRDRLGNVLAVKYPRPEMVGSKSQHEQACGDGFELDRFDRLTGAKLWIETSDWGKDYGRITLDRPWAVWRPYSTGALLKSKGGYPKKEIRDLSAELDKGMDLAKIMDSGTGTVKTGSGWELIA